MVLLKTLARVVATLKNCAGKARYSVWIPYHDGIDREIYISFLPNTNCSKYPNNKTQGLTCNNGRYLLYRERFIKWNGDDNPQETPRNVNIRILLNGIPEDINNYRRKFKYSIKDFHPKAQVWKSKMKY